MSKKILVTGGAGFLGANLCRKLLDLGHEVIAADNLCTGKKENLDDLYKFSRFTFLKHDVCDQFEIDRLDEIYNLACPASPPQYQRIPLETTKTSVVGAFNVLELARKTGAKILQASTSEVYGSPEKHPQTEDYWGNVNPVGLRSCYDEGKRCAETIFMDYHRQYDIPVRIARIFNTYGPGMAVCDGRVVSNFIVQALGQVPLTIYGDGSHTRSFCYVDDLIEGFLIFMDNSQNFIGPVNLGNSGEVTMLYLAKTIKELTHSSSQIVFNSLPEDDPDRRCPDITLAKKTLKWESTITLKDGLLRTICYFARHLGVKVPRSDTNC